MNNLYLGTDYSLAKSGVSIIKVEDRKPTIELAYLITSNPDKTMHQRIDETVTEIKYVAEKNDIEDIIREEGFAGQASTAVPIAKAHAIFEYQLMYKFNLDVIHNTSIKAWSRKIIGEDRAKEIKESKAKNKSKLLVKEAVERYYGEVPEMYTPRGKYIDDIGDAIALLTLWLEKKDLIDELNRFDDE